MNTYGLTPLPDNPGFYDAVVASIARFRAEESEYTR